MPLTEAQQKLASPRDVSFPQLNGLGLRLNTELIRAAKTSRPAEVAPSESRQKVQILCEQLHVLLPEHLHR